MIENRLSPPTEIEVSQKSLNPFSSTRKIGYLKDLPYPPLAFISSSHVIRDTLNQIKYVNEKQNVVVIVSDTFFGKHVQVYRKGTLDYEGYVEQSRIDKAIISLDLTEEPKKTVNIRKLNEQFVFSDRLERSKVN